MGSIPTFSSSLTRETFINTPAMADTEPTTVEEVQAEPVENKEEAAAEVEAATTEAAGEEAPAEAEAEAAEAAPEAESEATPAEEPAPSSGDMNNLHTIQYAFQLYQ